MREASRGRFSVVRGVGGYLPDRVITNDQLSETLDTSHEWIVRRTGICQRHLAVEGEFTSDLAIRAAQSALEHAGLASTEIDCIILATSTPNHTFPPTATLVQAALGAHQAVAFDLNAACSGFLFALSVADHYLRGGMFKRILVIGAETMSRLVDWQDRRTAVLFGDGAGAVVLEASEHDASKGLPRGILDMALFSDGRGYDDLYVTGGPSTSSERGTIHMNGAEVFRQAVQNLERSARELLQRTHTDVEDIAWFVSHQANERILRATGDRLGIPSQRLVFTGDKHANTSSASIPLALWEITTRGVLNSGDLVFLQAFGAGYTGGSCLLRW